MKGVDKIEFYMRGADKFIACVDSSMPPSVDDIVVIEGKSYLVVRRQFCVDHAADWSQTSNRCCVDLVKAKT